MKGPEGQGPGPNNRCVKKSTKSNQYFASVGNKLFGRVMRLEPPGTAGAAPQVLRKLAAGGLEGPPPRVQ